MKTQLCFLYPAFSTSQLQLSFQKESPLDNHATKIVSPFLLYTVTYFKVSHYMQLRKKIHVTFFARTHPRLASNSTSSSAAVTRTQCNHPLIITVRNREVSAVYGEICVNNYFVSVRLEYLCLQSKLCKINFKRGLIEKSSLLQSAMALGEVFSLTRGISGGLL